MMASQQAALWYEITETKKIEVSKNWLRVNIVFQFLFLAGLIVVFMLKPVMYYPDKAYFYMWKY